MEAHFPISGSHGDIGRRPTMEDRHLVLDDAGQTYGDILKDKRYAYYGVYDGHGGRDAADYCAKLFHTNLFNDPAFQEGRIEEALRNAFLNTDKQILEAAKTENFASGSTVVIGIIDLKDNIFYVANVGDSEAVVSKRNEAEGKYEPIVLTTKHKPSDQSEKDRIKKAGGHVVFGRVMGTLAVARAIGDRDFKHPFCKGEADFVSPEPAITKFQLTSDNDFIIISCDGLWEKLSYEQAMQFTGKLKDSGKNPQETTEVLVKEAIDKGSLDNVTAIVVYLSSPRPMKEMKSEKEEKEEKLENCDRDSDPELMTVWEFLRTGGEQKPNQDDAKLLKYFNLPPEEQLALQFPCALEKKLLYQGIMLLTQNYLCFYSTLFGKKILEQININDIETIEKQKSLLVANAIKITTKDGKKLFFNWKQNAGARDQVFSKLLDIIAKLDDTSPRPSVSRKDEKPEKQPEKQPEKTEKVEKTEKTEKEKTEKPKKTEEKEPEKLDKSRKPEEPQPEKVPERKTENPLYIYRERGVTKQPPKIRPSPESPSTSEPGSRRESEADKSEKRSEGSDSPKENRNS